MSLQGTIDIGRLTVIWGQGLLATEEYKSRRYRRPSSSPAKPKALRARRIGSPTMRPRVAPLHPQMHAKDTGMTTLYHSPSCAGSSSLLREHLCMQPHGSGVLVRVEPIRHPSHTPATNRQSSTDTQSLSIRSFVQMRTGQRRFALNMWEARGHIEHLEIPNAMYARRTVHTPDLRAALSLAGIAGTISGTPFHRLAELGSRFGPPP